MKDIKWCWWLEKENVKRIVKKVKSLIDQVDVHKWANFVSISIHIIPLLIHISEHFQRKIICFPYEYSQWSFPLHDKHLKLSFFSAFPMNSDDVQFMFTMNWNISPFHHLSGHQSQLFMDNLFKFVLYVKITYLYILHYLTLPCKYHQINT